MTTLRSAARIIAPACLAFVAATTASGQSAPTAPRPPVVVPPPAASVPADFGERMDAAGKLVEVMHLDKQFEALMPQILNLMMGTFVRGNTGQEDKIRAILGEELNTSILNQRPQLLKIYQQTYARNLTLEELEAMTAFYASDIGQSVLAKTPKLTQESMQSGQEIGRKAAMEAMPRILQRMQAARLEVPKGT